MPGETELNSWGHERPAVASTLFPLLYIYLEICWRLQSKSGSLSGGRLCSLLGWSFFNIEAMSQAPRKSTRATKGQPPEILDPVLQGEAQ